MVCDGAAEGRGVEVVHAGGGNVECAGLERGDTFGYQLLAAIDKTCFLGTVEQGFAGDFIVIGLVGLAEVSGVGVRDGSLGAHPVDGGAGIESAGESETNFFTRGQVLENVSHVKIWRKGQCSE